ncbi:hypothetical protein JCM3770_006419 [Rhodotorula araucariae]
MSKRSRDPLDDPRSGPSKNALRGLSYVGQQPKFLQNAMAALSGQTASAAAAAVGSGRAPVPTRPGGGDEADGMDSDDELDGATVVVLREGKHLDQDEVDRLRAQARANDAEDPFVAGAAEPERVKNTGSLSFSSGAAGGKVKNAKGGGGGGQGDWADVVKRSKDDNGTEKEVPARGPPAPVPAKTAEDKAKEREKTEKRKKKERKDARKKIGMLSFGEE